MGSCTVEIPKETEKKCYTTNSLSIAQWPINAWLPTNDVEHWTYPDTLAMNIPLSVQELTVERSEKEEWWNHGKIPELHQEKNDIMKLLSVHVKFHPENIQFSIKCRNEIDFCVCHQISFLYFYIIWRVSILVTSMKFSFRLRVTWSIRYFLMQYFDVIMVVKLFLQCLSCSLDCIAWVGCHLSWSAV